MHESGAYNVLKIRRISTSTHTPLTTPRAPTATRDARVAETGFGFRRSAPRGGVKPRHADRGSPAAGRGAVHRGSYTRIRATMRTHYTGPEATHTRVTTRTRK